MTLKRTIISLCLAGAPWVCAAQSISGITKPIHAVVLSGPMHGQIEQINVKEGDTVGVGQTLITLRHRVEALETEKLELIWKDKSALKAAANRKSTLAKLLESSQALYAGGGSISKEALSKEQVEARQAEADWQRLEVAEEKERLEYELAKEELDRRFIKSSIAGTVTRIRHDMGERYQINEPLIELVDTSRGWFIANVDDATGRRLRPAQEVSLSFQAGDKQLQVKGRVVYLAPVLDAASGLMEIKVEFANPDNLIHLGSSGTLNVD
ncbi:MAG: efflux RND transporter periplasmic adaptor subunit [Methylococcaceae bacterium]|nr:MAG: efflux RND transporter periplasmic adaptor subunit [Methylococcaceae bacterium]